MNWKRIAGNWFGADDAEGNRFEIADDGMDNPATPWVPVINDQRCHDAHFATAEEAKTFCANYYS